MSELAPAPRAVRIAASAAVLFAFVAMLGLAEIVVRWRSEQKYGYRDIDDLQYFDPEADQRRMHPNLHAGQLVTNSLGLRGPEPESPKPAGRIRLLFLGGSTTVSLEASSEEKTWPAVVTQKIAAAHPERSFDYVNGAAGGYVVADLHKAWKHRLARLEPDVVIIYEGTNDLSRDSRTLAIQQGLSSEDAEGMSWIGRRSLLVNLIEKNIRILARGSRVHDEAKKLDFDADELSRGFASRLRALVDDVKAAGRSPVLVTFSPRLRPGMTPEQQAEAMVTTAYYSPYLGADGALRGFAAFNRRVREIAAETGALLIEGEETIPPDAVHYHDSVHFTDAGCAKQAERVTAGLLASPAFTELLSR